MKKLTTNFKYNAEQKKRQQKTSKKSIFFSFFCIFSKTLKNAQKHPKNAQILTNIFYE